MGYVKALEKPIEAITLQDCVDMIIFGGKAAVINDGKLIGFENDARMQDFIEERMREFFGIEKNPIKAELVQQNINHSINIRMKNEPLGWQSFGLKE